MARSNRKHQLLNNKNTERKSFTSQLWSTDHNVKAVRLNYFHCLEWKKEGEKERKNNIVLYIIIIIRDEKKMGI